jgi:hypothetical protein
MVSLSFAVIYIEDDSPVLMKNKDHASDPSSVHSSDTPSTNSQRKISRPWLSNVPLPFINILYLCNNGTYGCVNNPPYFHLQTHKTIILRFTDRPRQLWHFNGVQSLEIAAHSMSNFFSCSSKNTDALCSVPFT